MPRCPVCPGSARALPGLCLVCPGSARALPALCLAFRFGWTDGKNKNMCCFTSSGRVILSAALVVRLEIPPTELFMSDDIVLARASAAAAPRTHASGGRRGRPPLPRHECGPLLVVLTDKLSKSRNNSRCGQDVTGWVAHCPPSCGVRAAGDPLPS